jgi:hypothetical protein
MHPQVRQMGPGNCPICGMALEPVIATGEEGESPELRDMTRRVWIGLALAVPVFFLEMGGHLFDIGHLVEAQTSNWIQLALGTPVVLWAGWPFFTRGWASVKNRSLNMFTLIALGTGLAGQGHYWRAVSQLRLRTLPAARADIEVAKRQARGPNSLTIAGIIEHDQDDLAIAEADLMEARGALRGDENCTAAWYLGLVFGKQQQRAKESAAGFEAAMQCYDVRVADARYRIGVLEGRPTRHPQVRARRIAALVADSVDNRSRYFASAFNAAGHLANAGDRARALQLLAIAASDPKLAEPVTRLRAAITAAR